MKKKILFQAILLVTVMGMTLYSLFHDSGLKTFTQTLSRTKPQFIFAALFLLLAYILLESVIIKIIMEALEVSLPITKCMKYSFIGFFFYCISPAGSAEQPMQMYFMHRDGINVPKSFVSMVLITITFKLSIVMLGCVVYIFRPTEVIDLIGRINLFCYLGLLLSIAFIAVITCALLSPESIDRPSRFAISKMTSYGLLKNPKKWEEKKDAFFRKYSTAISLLKGHPYLPTSVLLITIVQRLCYLAITAAACCSLGITEPNAFDVTAAQGMIQLGTEMLPLPGGLGINEMLYCRTFAPVLGNDTLSTLILSRGVGYYCQLIICGIATGVICIYTKLIERRKK